MKFTKTNKLLLGILALGALLRLVSLGSIPPHLTSDEAALGYNAYSILRTGKDEYAEPFPILFKSFGDYKPGLYVYTAIPTIALFGLNEFAVRLPSAISGILAIYLLFEITKLLVNQKKSKLPILTAGLLAISPWHIHFSRGAWEVNLALTLSLAGIYFFLKSLKNHKFLVLSSVFFALTTIAYQGAKLSTAIVLTILLLLYSKKLLKFPKVTIIKSLTFGLVIALPILLSFISGKTGRLTVFSVFSYPRSEEYLNNFLEKAGESKNTLTYYTFHNEPFNFFRGIAGRWFNHYSTRYLFFEGDWQNPRHSAPNHGVLLLGDFAFLLIGLYALTKLKNNKIKILAFTWLVFATLPSILSRDQVHAVRSYNLLIPLLMIIALGINQTTKHKKALVLLSFFYFASFVYFLDAYFIHLPKHDSQLWNYGYKQIVQEVWPVRQEFEQVKVQQSFAQPYIFFLFYSKYDPAKYQAQAELVESTTGDVGQVEKLENVHFSPIDWSINRGDKGSLVVGDPIRIPPADSVDPKEFEVKTINFLDGQEAFRVVKIK